MFNSTKAEQSSQTTQGDADIYPKNMALKGPWSQQISTSQRIYVDCVETSPNLSDHSHTQSTGHVPLPQILPFVQTHKGTEDILALCKWHFETHLSGKSSRHLLPNVLHNSLVNFPTHISIINIPTHLSNHQSLTLIIYLLRTHRTIWASIKFATPPTLPSKTPSNRCKLLVNAWPSLHGAVVVNDWSIIANIRSLWIKNGLCLWNMYIYRVI